MPLTVRVMLCPTASASVQPMVCSTNLLETLQMRRSPSSSVSQRPFKMGVSSAMPSSTARLTPVTVAVMVVSGSPYFCSVPLPT